MVWSFDFFSKAANVGCRLSALSEKLTAKYVLGIGQDRSTVVEKIAFRVESGRNVHDSQVSFGTS